MKLTKIIKGFFLFVSALLLTLTVSINHINAQTPSFDKEFINVDISVDSGILYSQSLSSESSSENRVKLPSAMYLIYIPVTLLINIILKNIDGTLRNPRQLPLLDNYEIAYLAGGKKRTIDLVIVNLIDSGSATFNSTTGKFCTYNIQGANCHPIEKTFISKINDRARFDIYNDNYIAENTLKKIIKYLEKSQLILTQKQSSHVLLTSAVPTILVSILMLFQNTLFGIVFILINLLLLPKIGNFLFPSRLYRSQYGDYLLKQLRIRNPRSEASSNISLEFALFGLRVIPLGHIETALSWTPLYEDIEVRGTRGGVDASFFGNDLRKDVSRGRDCD